MNQLIEVWDVEGMGTGMGVEEADHLLVQMQAAGVDLGRRRVLAVNGQDADFQ